MKNITYKTSGTCSQYVHIEADDHQIITSLDVAGGCHGNLQGISRLAVGMSLEEARQKLQGILCGTKSTSCPDQISKAIAELQKQY